jgi:rubrerythrin
MMDIDREYLRLCGYQPEEVTWDYKATKQYKTFAAGAKAVLDDIDRKGLALQSDMDKTIAQNMALKEEVESYKHSYDEYSRESIDRKGYVCPANKWNQELYEKSAAEVCPTCDHYEKDCIVYGRKKRKK